MLTARGWWLLVFVLCLTVAARFGVFLPVGRLPEPAPAANNALGLIGLALLLWFAWEWAVFLFHARFTVRRLRVTRELWDERGPVEAVWVRKAFEVQSELRLTDGLSLPFVRVTDRLPHGSEFVAGENQYEGAVAANAPLHFRYRLHCPAVGRVRFEGMRVQLSDYHGLFYTSCFIRAPVEYRVLPPLANAEGHAASTKRHNLLPPPGIHRLRRPGTGSELLDLRDYLPGDPPKTIAWKASARRDRLITKEFESEVPVRCTLFVDTSNAVRVGRPGQTPLNKLIEITAAVAQAAAGARDLTGLCLCDESNTTLVRPGRGTRHLARLMNLLVDAASLNPTRADSDLSQLLTPAYRLAQQVYPDLLRPELNRIPAWLPWLRPQRAWTMRKPGWADRFNAWTPWLVMVYVLAGVTIAGYAALSLRYYLFPRWRRIEGDVALLFSLVVAGLILALAIALAALPSFLFPRQRRVYRRRKLLSALLALRYGPCPGGLALMMEDEELFIRHLHRFLGEHRVRLDTYLSEGTDRAAAVRKVSVLAGALLRAVSKGHDNELYVLMADLLGIPEQLDPLLRAVRVAVARHHRVILVCPWPDGVPPPAADRAVSPAPDGFAERLHQSFQQVRRMFARMGVPVICAQGGDPAGLILGRMNRLRMLGAKR